MERSKLNEQEISAMIEATPATKLTKKQYNEISQELKAESLTADINNQIKILSSASRVNLNDVDEVKAMTEKYFRCCAEAQTPPLFMQLCTTFGYSRQAVYAYMRQHPNTETTQFLNCVQTSVASIIAQQGLRRNLSEPLTIFLLKNSGNGLKDTVEVDAVAHDPTADLRDRESLLAKYQYEEE